MVNKRTATEASLPGDDIQHSSENQVAHRSPRKPVGSNVAQELKEQEEGILKLLMRSHQKRGEEAAKAFSNEIDSIFRGGEETGDKLFEHGQKRWTTALDSIQSQLPPLPDVEVARKLLQAERSKSQPSFDGMEQNVLSMKRAIENGQVEDLPLVYEDRQIRLKDYRRAQIAALKAEEAEEIEYKEMADGAKLLTAAVRSMYQPK